MANMKIEEKSILPRGEPQTMPTGKRIVGKENLNNELRRAFLMGKEAGKPVSVDKAFIGGRKVKEAFSR